ncbi:MAG: superoxide dismutase [Patescibacteria group bacterium]
MKKYEVPALPYAYDALEPYIDAETLHYHHDKHHKAYADKFNAALERYPELYEKTLDDLFRDIEQVPDDIRMAVINQGGGYINHNLFWESLAPKAEGLRPKAELAEAMERDLSGFDQFREKLTAASTNQFGSGYGWLVKGSNGKLKIYGLPNQDSPLSLGHTPLLLIDVWEHAYYLKYKNMRADYVNSIWNIINWEKVSERFAK